MELLTPRLRIREFRADDFDALYAIDSNPLVCKYEARTLTAEEVRYRLEGALEWANETPRRIYKLAITLPPDDRVHGRLSLRAVQPATREWEIGWTLHPDAWGRGLASEGARALLAYAFEQLHAHRVTALCHAENQASIRVMQKIGMHPEALPRETPSADPAIQNELLYAILEKDFSPSGI